MEMNRCPSVGKEYTKMNTITLSKWKQTKQQKYEAKQHTVLSHDAVNHGAALGESERESKKFGWKYKPGINEMRTSTLMR